MELNYIKLTSFFALLIFIITLPLNAQVGINTVTPSPGAMLDIESSDKGLLIPRVALTGTNDTGTITPSATKGLLVFNTATAGAGLSAVTEGFYYWDSSKWVPFQVGNNTAWEISGNDNITNGTHFLGTLNNRDLDFRTNGTDRFRIPGNADQVLAMANGSAAAPFYSWNDDRTMGFWKSGLRQMDMVINGTTYFNANANTSGSSDLEWTFNPGGVDLNLRVETDNNANALFVNGELDNIGLGTNAPVPSAQLEMADISKGLLVNRVVLTATNVAAPVTSPATGLLVFNTNTAGSAPNNVKPGFYFWEGTQWMPLQDGRTDWEISGNDNIINGTNFIGTTNDQQIDFRTNNVDRLRLPGNQSQLQAMANGTNALPFYSWETDPDVGLWRPNTDQLALSAGGREFVRLIEAGSDALVINEGGADIDTRIETNDNANMLFVDGGTNRVGINTNAPQTELHVAGNGTTVRIDELNDANNTHNIGVDPAPVYVDTNGDLTLQPPLVQTFMPINLVDFIGAGGVTITSPWNNGTGVTTDLLNTTITLTQESLVHITYQFSVEIYRRDGTVLIDGASRLFRSGVLVNSDPVHVGYSTGTYTNNPDVTSGSHTYAAGYYYLTGNGYVQLPAGTHTLKLEALGFGGSYDYRMVFGASGEDRFQVVVHR